ncbi:hypothetical protein [Piscinibacter sakaiensis]|uniref:hypothetical protein n=1 Tax=Piscinibacter sakaiensis TaxID=1547922 RepID=UPI003AAAA737
MTSRLSAEIAAAAARLVVEEGLEYGQAKRRAARDLGAGDGRKLDLPSNDELEEEVRSYIELFCADSQPQELRALRELALTWMERLAEFRPHLTGAVWRGTATRLSDIHLQLFCDDAKSAELALIDRGVNYHVGAMNGPRNEKIDVLSIPAKCPSLGDTVTVHLSILDHDDMRGALKADGQGRSPRGGIAALRGLLEGES